MFWEETERPWCDRSLSFPRAEEVAGMLPKAGQRGGKGGGVRGRVQLGYRRRQVQESALGRLSWASLSPTLTPPPPLPLNA